MFIGAIHITPSTRETGLAWFWLRMQRQRNGSQNRDGPVFAVMLIVMCHSDLSNTYVTQKHIHLRFAIMANGMAKGPKKASAKSIFKPNLMPRLLLIKIMIKPLANQIRANSRAVFMRDSFR